MMSVLANALPENTGDGYVAAAYIVFFVILLVYVAIMALRLSHVQRDLRDLQARSAGPAEPGGRTAPEQAAAQTGSAGGPSPLETAGDSPQAQALEREPA